MNEFVVYLKHNKSAAVALALLLFLTLATILTLTLSRRSQDLRSKAATDNGQLTLAVGNIADFQRNQSFPVQVNMLNGGQAVTGADILVEFDQSKLTLTTLTKPAHDVFKTFAPVTTTGAFDTAKVIFNANSNDPAIGGIVEFGITSYDWATNTLTSPSSANSAMAPVSTLTFNVKSNAAFGPTTIKIRNLGTNSTTDSNIVVIPSGTNTVPEDILQDPLSYTGHTVTVNIVGLNASPSPSPSSCPGISCNASPTPTPAASPCVGGISVCASPTPPPGAISVVLKLDFEGLFDDTPLVHNDPKPVQITIDGGNPTLFDGTVNFVYDTNEQAFTNTANPIVLQNAAPGQAFSFLIKGPVHLARRFNNIQLATGPNEIDLTAPNQLLLAGDAVNNANFGVASSDNTVDLDDFTLFVSHFGSKEPGAPGQIYTYADFDYNDKVDGDDYYSIVVHYGDVGEN